MSARDWRAVREGDAHTATKTSPNNTPESLIVGVGASGALLAGAAIVFITLVGLVSFNVWPATGVGSAVGNIELGNPARAFSPAPTAPAAPVDQVTTTDVVSPGARGGGGGSPGRGGDRHKTIQRPAPSPAPAPVAPPSASRPGNGNGNSSGNGDGRSNGNGNGRGNGNGQTAEKSSLPPGQAKKVATGQSKVPPGQTKKTARSATPTSNATESPGSSQNSGNGKAHSGK